MKKILLTGSNGLLGQKLVKLITEKQDFELIATSRGANRLPHSEGYIYESMDITNPAEIAKVMAKHQPHFLIHTAAMTNVDECELNQGACWQQNVEAVKLLVEACEKHHTFLLHLSTDFIFDGEDGPYNEKARPNPISYYGESKLMAETIIWDSNIRWAIARTVLVYGIVPNMSRSNIILWVKKSLEDKKEIKVVDDQWRTPTLAEDLAMGCYLIVLKEATGIFNISGKEMLTPYQMALKTAQFFQLDTSTMQKADASTFSQPAKRPPKTGFVIEKAEQVLDYQPHTFEEGIALLNEQMALLE